ncbi:MAG: hypothetical protein JST41_02375 [Bacteroidetes bacterium]|nr:hypothetical protein [Bacteroidota bacterium]MBX7128152.1 hypothetical protein [Flavobacteriales bacterium]MCC6655554.1 hypothetical protein [Flavobacteriales bacterium]HMU15792.1 hypothetical protein [Flavobacteriales bacterium]HMZ47634.1 hypothetical protein [Flavobacteriales bacterium]
MRFFLPFALVATLPALGQYGTFDTKAIAAAKANTTVVVLDDTNTGYNPAITSAVKADWKFTAATDFINTADLGTQPLDPAKNYLVRILRKDAEKHDAVFLALVAGWKQKKGEALIVENGAVTNIPAAQELASIMIDPVLIGSTGSALLNVYVKHLQDYLKNVQSGKIKDKATADRLYAGRTRLIKEMKLHIARTHLDKTVPDAAKVKETYTHEFTIGDEAANTALAGSSADGAAITDVVITGEHKTKWCFKRVFNARTGELLYLRDDAALFDKKLGFLSEDLRMIEQSR